MLRIPLAALLFLLLTYPAHAEISRPTLSNPTVCHVPVEGTVCNFGASEDGVVDFPDAAAVTGWVAVQGGATIWFGGDLDGESGVGGFIDSTSGNTTVFFNSPNTVFIEGIYIDNNGKDADAFVIRNQLGIATDFTFQNIYVEGTTYQTEHGDVIQNQDESSAGTLSLHVENFAAITNAQGFFIPARGSGGAGNDYDLTNVYLKMVPTPEHSFPLLWFWDQAYDARDKKHAVTLDNVWIDYGWGGAQIYPTGTTANNQMTWASEPDIIIAGGGAGSGVINQGVPPEDVFTDFAANTGLNYDRTFFFVANPAPPNPLPGPVSATNIANAATYDSDSGNFNASNPVAGMWDGCIDETPSCSPSAGNTGETSFWVIYDLGASYDLASARLHGDYNGSWVSDTWTLDWKLNIGDSWTTHFTAADASDNDWFDSADISAVTAQYVRVTVNGSPSVQAREFELEGVETVVAIDHVHTTVPGHAHSWDEITPNKHSHPTNSGVLTDENWLVICRKRATSAECTSLLSQ